MDKYNNRLLLLCVLIILVMTAFIVSNGNFNGDKPFRDTTIITTHDTMYLEKHDTVPQVKKEEVIRYVKIPVDKDNHKDNYKDSLKDTVEMALVQKVFSDDSTYTAYVSGLKYDKYPILDSIVTRQRTVTNTIIKTITVTKKSGRWNVGMQVGYGYGFIYRGFEPYIGVGVQYTIFPK